MRCSATADSKRAHSIEKQENATERDKMDKKRGRESFLATSAPWSLHHLRCLVVHALTEDRPDHVLIHCVNRLPLASHGRFNIQTFSLAGAFFFSPPGTSVLATRVRVYAAA